MKTCVICGEVLTQHPGETDSNWRRRRSCGRECGIALATKSRMDRWYEKNGAKPSERACAVCGKDISGVKRSRATCSGECAIEFKRRNQRERLRANRLNWYAPGGRILEHEFRRVPQSIYRGVAWNADTGAWVAAVAARDGLTVIGPFETDVEAARAYDEEARRRYGAHARTNFSGA